ncbi:MULTISPECIES: hypothetical protein [Paenibacillus]|uniref:hypothetical protein n=1 Tax=Paenibacillus TaxID=44249 RepID=UPI0009B8AFA2|nr:MULTISPECIES: hypothetical protein [Paenibacillus]PNQ80865.1 hypothetical protein C1T21_12215 [Paenibacillus sp. F4]WCM61698.1 hypothetical protein OYT09_01455 [Paenibacillus polymyxa]
MLSHMVNVLGILLIAAAISLVEVPYMWKKGLKKELWLFSILLFVAVGISCAKALHWLIPTPLDWITAVYRPFSDFLTHIGLIR